LHDTSIPRSVGDQDFRRKLFFGTGGFTIPFEIMDLRFADPYILALLLAVPALGAVILIFRRERSALTVGRVPSTMRVPRTWRTKAEPWLPLLRLVAVSLLIVALARPQRGEAVAESDSEGIDIVLAYDVSSSMSELFARGESRQQAAANVLREFVEARSNDRVGLVIFRGNTLTLSPLTTDYRALSSAIEFAPSIRLDDGTAIGSAIAESVRALDSSEAASKIVILLTDGQNNASTIEPLASARIAESLGVRVYTIGVVSNVSGRLPSTVNVDEAALREIANVTGATYSRAEDPAALERIYETIDQLEKSRFETGRFTRYEEIAPWFLIAAACVLVLELLLRTTWLRRAS
jgi:Ca-activated chloride channel family protein